MDTWLVVLCAVVPSILVVVNFYVLVYFQDPADKRAAYFPKALVVVGLTLAEAAVLLIPLDVANRSGAPGCDWAAAAGTCGGLDLALVWQAVYVSIAAFVVLLIPFAIFYYEADDAGLERRQSQCCAAMRYEIIALVVGAVVFFASIEVKRNRSIRGCHWPLLNFSPGQTS